MTADGQQVQNNGLDTEEIALTGFGMICCPLLTRLGIRKVSEIH